MLRILVVVYGLGYLRFVDPVIRELLARGHQVHLLFERDDRDPNQERWLEEMGGVPGFSFSRSAALRADPWRGFAKRLRTANDLTWFASRRFRSAPYLVARARSRAPRWARVLLSLPVARSDNGLAFIGRVLGGVESAIPVNGPLLDEIAGVRPDAVLVCPQMTPGTRNSEYVRSARALGIRTAISVASWDNLSSKQQIHVLPDRVIVWNETQRTEATEFHGVPEDRVVVTGAHPFDHWFDWRPRSREAFLQRVGLDPAKPYILYVGGALFPAETTEDVWALRWLRELRRAAELARAGVLVRPHPNRGGQWRPETFAEEGNVAIWPPHQDQMPLDEERRADFFDSVHHSAAVFGLNTSAMIDAAVIGRPVYTMLVPEFAASQTDVLHFNYLLRSGDGVVRVAADFGDLRSHLTRVLATADADGGERRRAFVASFVRPRGLERPAAAFVADAVEELAALPPPSRLKAPRAAWLLRAPLALYVRAQPERVRAKTRLLLTRRRPGPG